MRTIPAPIPPYTTPLFETLYLLALIFFLTWCILASAAPAHPLLNDTSVNSPLQAGPSSQGGTDGETTSVASR
jgi:hypothetical protein